MVEWIWTPALEVNNVVRTWQPDKKLPRSIYIREIADQHFCLQLYTHWEFFNTADAATERAEEWMDEKRFQQ